MADDNKHKDESTDTDEQTRETNDVNQDADDNQAEEQDDLEASTDEADAEESNADQEQQEATDSEDDASEASGSGDGDETEEAPDAANGWTDDDGFRREPPARRPAGGGPNEPEDAPGLPDDGPLLGIVAFFDHPDRTLEAARATRDSKYDGFDVYTPFPVHGMDEAMGLGRSWIPWVTFVAGLVGFICANAMQFGMMTFDWPMIIGGKPFAPWPSFVPIMFELTVLIGGVTTGVVMLKAAGCFQEPMVLDRDLTDDRFAVWISADDPEFDVDEVRTFLSDLDPTEIRGITNEDT